VIGHDASPAHDASTPSAWIVRFAHLVSRDARVLDLACGAGRHARFFAHRGCRVLAVDRDAAAIGGLQGVRGIDARVVELEGEQWPLAQERFDAIVVADYLHRPLFPHLLAALTEAGVLLYETFARGNEAYGRPSNPDFLLKRDELLDVCRQRLAIVAFEQGYVRVGQREAVVQRIVAVAPSYPVSLPLVPH